MKYLLGIVLIAVSAPGLSAHAQSTNPIADFSREARLLFDVAACGTAARPRRFRTRAVDRHCKKLNAKIAAYKKSWLRKARPFFAKIVPKQLPNKVVYPFAGGDLLTALAVFPDMRELTTISLEPAGDPRVVDHVSAKAFGASLGALRYGVLYLLRVGFSATVNLDQIMVKSRLPGQLLFSLIALAAHGYEPVSLRYFRLGSGGGIRYLRKKDIAAFVSMTRPARNQLFGNMELTFRRMGKPNNTTIVYRHVFADLANAHLGKPLMMHLRSKGRIAAMTKAASYLLWWRKFSKFRAYLLQNVTWMVSDASGLLPMHAKPAGFQQRTWGRFNGAILNIAAWLTADARRLWRSQARRKLPFRFGYPDSDGHSNLLVTYRNK